MYDDDKSRFETNVRDAGWKCQGLNLALFIRECILFHLGEHLPDSSLKIIVQQVGLGTVSVTRDTLLIAAVKKSAVFAETILDMDPFDEIYDMVLQGNLAADQFALDALNLSHRLPGSQWKNASQLSQGDLQGIIRRKIVDQERKRMQLLFYLCTVLSADALEWFKYLILPERGDVDESPGLPEGQDAEAVRE